jgi:hypothetical protein
MSHAQTGRQMLVGSSLTKEQLTDWLYTANAATASERFTFASLSAWLIEKSMHRQVVECSS